jgi:5-methyltetrahydrofolate--homocysteine methyltransferase
MSDSYTGTLDPTVGRMVPVYRLIAQNLNSVRPDVRRALSENRWTPIDRLIRRLARVGVYGIDIQLDWPGADRVALYEAFIRRLHETAPEVRPVIDWPDAAAWARLVPRCPVRPVVNSLPAHPLRPAALDVIGQFRPEVIVLCATEETTRLTPAERLELAYEAYRALRACGLEDEAIYFDAVLFPLVYRRPGADPTDTLETIRRLRDHFPRCHVLVGLANLTFRWGADERAKTVGQATFLAMAVAAGLDAVIMDPLVPVLRRVWSSAQAILRRDGGAT